MNRSGQVINIDWTIALSVFVVAVASATLLVVGNAPMPSSIESLQIRAIQSHSNLDSQTYATGRKAPLIVSTPHDTGKIPIDQEYIFVEDGVPGTGAMDIPADVNITRDRIITVTGTGKRTHWVSYFFTDMNDINYTNSIDVGTWMNSSDISVKPGDPGITSLRINDQEVLKPYATINPGRYSASSYNVDEKELHAESLDGNLKVYNGTNELILEDADTITFELENFTRLYWYDDNNPIDMDSVTTYRNGATKGFTVANVSGAGYGATFIGDMTATVSRPDMNSVRAEIDADRLRIFLHDTGYKFGKKRIENFAEGTVEFGGERVVSGATSEKIAKVNRYNLEETREKLDFQSYNFNISFGVVKTEGESTESSWKQGTMNNVTASHPAYKGTLIQDRGNSSDLIGWWTFQNEAGAVIDSSGNGNSGAAGNGPIRGVSGIKGTKAIQFTGENNHVNISDSTSLSPSDQISLSFWVKPEKTDVFFDGFESGNFTHPDSDYTNWKLFPQEWTMDVTNHKNHCGIPCNDWCGDPGIISQADYINNGQSFCKAANGTYAMYLRHSITATTPNINLSSASSGTLSWYWKGRSMDSDTNKASLSVYDGSSWVQLRCMEDSGGGLDAGCDVTDDEKYHYHEVDVSSYLNSQFKIRVTGPPGSWDDLLVDNVRLKTDSNSLETPLRVVSKAGNSNFAPFQVYVGDNEVFASVNETGLSSSLNQGWNHIGVNYDNGGSTELYVNGDLKDSMPASSPVPDTSGDLTFGSYGFIGTLDELRLSDTALGIGGLNYLRNSRYVSTIKDPEGENDWSSLNMDIWSAVTDLNARVQALNSSNSVVEEQEIDIERSVEKYPLDLNKSDRLRVIFDGFTANASRTWAVDSYSVKYGDFIEEGYELPFTNVVVSSRPSVMVDRYGNYTRIEGEVAVWK